MSIRIKPWKDSTEEFEIIQWNYDKSQGRSIPKKIGNFRITWLAVPPELLKNLTEDEKQDLLIFWKTTKEGRRKEKLKKLAKPVADMCGDVKEALQSGLLTQEVIEKIAEEIDALKKEISKAKRIETIKSKKGVTK